MKTTKLKIRSVLNNKLIDIYKLIVGQVCSYNLCINNCYIVIRALLSFYINKIISKYNQNLPIILIIYYIVCV